eukprot:gnl/TRDRNA2_/TRDRNA2_141888_c4_seq1.p1 gnl/TRDRNA2_/TRDRNA2_141888_c4~~gnl/TRDRNA2_/TRDRNA2_141888_c4_seq1.p1  ORF type:complete len:479 (+),score=76.76 gnl/TRDRNA2_/TRDRNA2_141888_c4_seq1:211-1437(+)
MASICLRLGMIGKSEDLDASWLSPDGLSVTSWPSVSSPVKAASLHPVKRAIFATLPDIRVIVGVRTKCVEATAHLPSGPGKPLSQTGAGFYGSVASCTSADDAADALRKMPGAFVLWVRDEARVFVFAPTPGEAFVHAFFLDRVCRVQLLVGDKPVVEPSRDTWVHAKKQFDDVEEFRHGVEWPALTAWINGRSVDEAIEARQGELEEKEQMLRKQLSDAHKDLHLRKMVELTWNHASAKLESGDILITPGDRMWCDVEPETIKTGSVNVTAGILHHATYKGAPSSTGAVVHVHAPAIEAVSCLQEGFRAPPDSEFAGTVAYHNWEGISDDVDESDRLVADMKATPGCIAIMMRNHGSITIGATVQEALERTYRLDAACREQLLAAGVGSNVALAEISDDPYWRDHRP